MTVYHQLADCDCEHGGGQAGFRGAAITIRAAFGRVAKNAKADRRPPCETTIRSHFERGGKGQVAVRRTTPHAHVSAKTAVFPRGFEFRAAGRNEHHRAEVGRRCGKIFKGKWLLCYTEHLLTTNPRRLWGTAGRCQSGHNGALRPKPSGEKISGSNFQTSDPDAHSDAFAKTVVTVS